MGADSDEPLVFYAGRGQLVVLLLGALVFVVAGVWMMGSGDLLGTVFGPVAVVFFGLGAVVICYRLVVRRPTLVLDGDGIRSGGVLVPWNRVDSLTVSTMSRQPFLGVHVRDEGGLLSGVPTVKRAMMGVSRSFTGAPVNIPLREISMPVDELVAEIERRRTGWS